MIRHEDLVSQLYAVLLGETGWDSFLAALTADQADGKAVMMLHNLDGTGRGELCLHHNVPDQARQDYATYYSRINPWLSGHVLRDTQRGIPDTDVISRAELHRSEYYRDYLQPLGIEGSAGLTLSVQGHEAIVLSAMTADPDPAAAARMALRLTRLLPHLQRLGPYYEKARNEASTGLLPLAALDRTGVGIGLVDRSERLVHLSERAARLAGAHGLLPAVSARRFRFRAPSAQAVLRDMLRRDYAGPSDVVMRIGGLRLTFFRPPQSPVSDLLCGPMTGFLVEPLRNTVSLDLLEAAQSGYNLTPAEVRALDGILRGQDIRNMSSQNGVSVETIRSQVKSLLHKTGMANQIALFRLMVFGEEDSA